MLVIPFAITAFLTSWSAHGAGLLALYSLCFISPVPLMVSVPSLSSVQVRLLPSPSAPQVPLPTIFSVSVLFSPQRVQV